MLAGKKKAESELIRRQQKRRSEVEEWKKSLAKTKQDEIESKLILMSFLNRRSEALGYRAFAAELETVIRNEDVDDDYHLLCEFKDWVEKLADKEDPFIRSGDSSECMDIWALAERVKLNAEIQRQLLSNQPLYSKEELGLDSTSELQSAYSSHFLTSR